MALQEELKTQGDFLFRHRSYLPLLILGIGLAVFVNTKYFETGISDAFLSEIFAFVCLGVSLFGLLIRILTVGHTPKTLREEIPKEDKLQKN